MAKKDKDTIFNEFLADLKSVNPQIEEILKDEKVSAKLKEGVLARAEFSSQMDALSTERRQFESEVAEARQKIERWQDWYGKTSQEVATIQDELKRYRDEYGELTHEGRRAAKAQGLTAEEFDKKLQDEINKRDLANLKFADDLTDIKIDYRERFKEKLDTGAVFKIAGEKNLPLDAAYNIFIADKVEEQRKVAYAEEIKRNREEAVAEYAAKHNLPVIDSNPAHVHVLDMKDVPTDSSSRVSAAVAAFMNRNR